MKSNAISKANTSFQQHSLHPKFTKNDYLVVRRAMDELPLIEKLAVEMRFFHNFSIEEISRLLRIEWDEAEGLIESALGLLKEQCLSEPDFSRSVPLLRAA